MQVVQRLGAALVLGIAVAACSGGGPTQVPTTTQAGGGAGGGGGAATQQPAATDAGNGGGGGDVTGGGLGGDTSKGKAHFEIGAPVSKTVDYAFSPALSHFGGTQETILYFVSTDGTEGALSLTWTDDTFVAVFTGIDATVSGDECTTTNVKVEAASASGQFSCPKDVAILASGATASDVSFTGTFEAKG
jgi:hypothetical protein